MKRLLTTLIMIATIGLSAQDAIEKAYELGMQAIQEMEAGNTEIAINLLAEAHHLDKENIKYPYEVAYAHFLDRNYKEAIQILKELLDHPQVIDRIYQLLGSCYDLNGKISKAVEVFEDGIELFPNSGLLYLERGNMELIDDNLDRALYYFEKGIEVDPTFPSNYASSSLIYLNSSNKVMGLIYGELFMNLERNSSRTVEMSIILYQAYRDNINFKSDGSFTIDLVKRLVIDPEFLRDTSKFQMPFDFGLYFPTLGISLGDEHQIDLESLNRIRKKFIDFYFGNEKYVNYPNESNLFQFHEHLNDLGLFEAYNFWLLSKGNEDDFYKWLDLNEEKWDQFNEWFIDNSIVKIGFLQ